MTAALASQRPAFEGFKPPSRRRPCRRLQRCLANGPQSYKLQIGYRDIARWASSLWRASEHTAPRRGYFFFLATAFFFAGAFFFAAVFAFVAFFTMMPSSSELAVLHQHVRES